MFEKTIWKLWKTGGIQPVFIIFGALMAGISVLQALSLAGVATQLYQGHRTMEGSLRVWMILFGLCLVIKPVIGARFDSTASARAQRLGAALRTKTENHWIAPEAASAGGQYTTLHSEGIEAVTDALRFMPQTIFHAGWAVIFCLATAWILDPVSGLILTVTVPLLPFFMRLVGMLAKGRDAQQWKKLSRLGGQFEEMVRGLTTLRAYRVAKRQQQVIEGHAEDWRKTSMGLMRIVFLSAFVQELLGTLGTALIAVSAAVRLVQGSADLFAVLGALFVAPEFYGPLRQMGLQYHVQMKAAGFLQILGHMEDDAAEEKEDAAGEIPASIGLENASVRFGSHVVLDGISIRFERGRLHVLSGDSGTGKTTLLRALAGAVRLDSGCVSVNGKPSAIASGLLGWVAQESILSGRTLREMIQMKPGDEPHVMSLIRQSGLDWKDETCLDRDFGENGMGLSGGQRQRISLIRALMREPAVLLVDEGTAHLDPEAEKAVLDILEAYARRAVVILVTHHPERIPQAQRSHLTEGGIETEVRV